MEDTREIEEMIQRNIKLLKEKNNLSDEDFAKIINKKAEKLENWDNICDIIDLKDLIIISDFFGIEISELLKENFKDNYKKS